MKTMAVFQLSFGLLYCCGATPVRSPSVGIPGGLVSARYSMFNSGDLLRGPFLCLEVGEVSWAPLAYRDLSHGIPLVRSVNNELVSLNSGLCFICLPQFLHDLKFSFIAFTLAYGLDTSLSCINCFEVSCY